MWFVFHVAKSAGNMIVGRLVERLGARRLIIAGWVAYAAVYFGFALATEAWHAWALFMSYAVFYALTEPPEKTLVAQLVPGERKGLAYGWYNFAIGVAAMPASVLFGYLYKDYGGARGIQHRRRPGTRGRGLTAGRETTGRVIYSI